VDVSNSNVQNVCGQGPSCVGNGSSGRTTTFTIEPLNDEPHAESLHVYVNEPSPPAAAESDNVGDPNLNRKVQFGLDSPGTCDGSAYTTEEGSSGMYSHSSDGISIASGCPSLNHFFSDVPASDVRKETDVEETRVCQELVELLDKKTETMSTLSHGSLQSTLLTGVPLLSVPSNEGISPASSAASFTKILDVQRILKRNETVSKLIEKTKEIRNQTKFQCLSDNNDQLKHLFETKLPYPEASFVGDKVSPVEAPHYLCIRIDNKKLKRSSLPSDTSLMDSQISRIQSSDDQQRYIVHWFTIPKSKVAILYACLLNWLPADEFDQSSSSTSSHFSPKQAKKSKIELRQQQDNFTLGFILLQKEDRLEINDERDQAVKRLSESECDVENGAELNLNQQWEIVTVEEVKRRMSFMNIIEPETLQLPDKSDRPVGMTDAMLDQLLRVLPPRAQGYPWKKVFSTEEDGFSLNTLFRRMVNVPDWSSSIILITDSRNVIFGAFINCPLRLSDNSLYYGTGESFVFTFKPCKIQTEGEKIR
uniref:Oxidation resistance protein 1 n=1 Tax=Romanomermis culicivorax TaxID=13658 RepID=A0A915IUE5_ROMCU